jgi:hypothetical protein
MRASWTTARKYLEHFGIVHRAHRQHYQIRLANWLIGYMKCMTGTYFDHNNCRRIVLNFLSRLETVR